VTIGRAYHPRMDGIDPQIQVERATSRRLPDLAGVLGRAFAHDPMTQWPFDGNASVETITSIFALLYEHPVELGLVWEAGDGAGVAVWVPPGAAELLSASDEAAREKYEPLMPDRGERYREMWGWLEAYVAEDAWYLDAIGVDPSRQRSGVGGALIRHGLALAAKDGAPAFLETSVATNVPYYERFGFNVVDQGDAPSGGPHIWFMRRESDGPPL
jgi:ribosomal protein S18 acetylase RimI-like enzyme